MYHRVYTPSDFDLVCKFLYDLFKSSGTINHWLPTRFENGHMDEDETYYLWEDEGKLVGVLTSEKRHRFLNSTNSECLRAMLNFLKDQDVIISCTSTNLQLQPILREYSYQTQRVEGYIRIYDSSFIPKALSLPDGYSFQELTEEYHTKYAAAVRDVFGHQFFDEDVIRYLQSRSFWIQDLDLLIIDDDGEIGSFSTLRIDPVYHITELEPLGTTPNHRGKGLAQAIIMELLIRHQAYQSDLIYIGGAANTPPANAVYDATGFRSKIEEWFWTK